MPFIPHTEADTQAMLAAIGADSIERLFDEIPESLRFKGCLQCPTGMSELQLTQWLSQRASQNKTLKHFCGAGAYDHFIPAAVWQVASRGEFLTAYTPYQAEASQGSLQLLYEYQTMMASLMGMEVANASLYDGATSLAEAVLMSLRANKKNKSNTVLLPDNLHPFYRETVETIVRGQGIDIKTMPFNSATGQTELPNISEFAALVIAMPNFFGGIDALDALTDFAHANNALVIACVNPMACALFKEPGQWGEKGADIACGEGQPLGVPLAFGGPYFGFLTTQLKHVRQMPGRICGRTTDKNGKVGFTLTLQAREQHIRRSKATSNICTNQGLLVTAATIYMSIMGPEGLKNIAAISHSKTRDCLRQLLTVEGISQTFNGVFAYETAINLPDYAKANTVIDIMAEHGFNAGFALAPYFKSLPNALLISVTETKTDEDIAAFVSAMANSLVTLKKNAEISEDVVCL